MYEGVSKIFDGKFEEKRPLCVLVVYGRIILQWTLKRDGSVRVWTGFTWLKIATSTKLENTVMNFRVPEKAGKFLTG
jgi:hypothetical protein